MHTQLGRLMFRSMPTTLCLATVEVLIGICIPCAADDVLYRYEADVYPYDESAGWAIFNACDGGCVESLEAGHYVTVFDGTAGDIHNFTYVIDGPGDPPPPDSLWVEWRYRSNQPKPPFDCSCDKQLKLRYGHMFEPVQLFGDAAFSFSCAHGITGLEIDEFHTYRYESLNGSDFWVAADGSVFLDTYGTRPLDGVFLQFGGAPSCGLAYVPVISEWDMIRFGTIDFGELITASDPPAGYLEPDTYPALDRFAVTFDSPNYVYLDQISVEVSGGTVPVVIKTWRRENDEPHTLEVLLDRPIPAGEHTRFIFNDGVAINVVDYSYMPADSDGNGRIDLADVATFQTCFGSNSPSGACLACDLDDDGSVGLADFASFRSLLDGP